MKNMIARPWYPFMFAAYPVLALLAYNLGQVKYTDGIRALIFSIVMALLLFLLLRFLYRSIHRAAFVTAGLALLFYTYGQVYDLILPRQNIPNFTALMLVFWLVLAILVFVLAALPKIKFDSAALALNVASLWLLVFPTFQVIQGSFVQPASKLEPSYGTLQDLRTPDGQIPPDIYYIMPEDYGRTDFLQTSFHIDDSQFTQFLKDTGFYVAECSQSNYVRSELSLGSSLNMNYLQDLSPDFKATSSDQVPIWNSIRYSLVMQSLEQAGYKTVAFATGFAWSELDNADVYISPSPFFSGLTNFESLLLRTTPLLHFEGVGMLNLDQIDGQRYRERTLLAFNSMDQIAKMPGPKFVFVHIIAPHEPFVFAPDGSPIDPSPFINERHLYTKEKYIQGFQSEIPYVNLMLEKTITTLINNSATPPVIILQTDTAPLFTSGSDQFKILNAYYMPGHMDGLYPAISPVNTFRLIFNSYLNGKYDMLPDVSYFSPVPKIYNFKEVSNTCK